VCVCVVCEREKEGTGEIYTQNNGKHFCSWNVSNHTFFDKGAENEEKEIYASSLVLWFKFFIQEKNLASLPASKDNFK
jgi:hypothetical protein